MKQGVNRCQAYQFHTQPVNCFPLPSPCAEWRGDPHSSPSLCIDGPCCNCYHMTQNCMQNRGRDHLVYAMPIVILLSGCLSPWTCQTCPSPLGSDHQTCQTNQKKTLYCCTLAICSVVALRQQLEAPLAEGSIWGTSPPLCSPWLISSPSIAPLTLHKSTGTI